MEGDPALIESILKEFSEVTASNCLYGTIRAEYCLYGSASSPSLNTSSLPQLPESTNCLRIPAMFLLSPSCFVVEGRLKLTTPLTLSCCLRETSCSKSISSSLPIFFSFKKLRLLFRSSLSSKLLCSSNKLLFYGVLCTG